MLVLHIQRRILKARFARNRERKRRSHYVMLPWSQNFWISTIRGLVNKAEKKEELNFLCTIALKNKAVALTF